MPVYFIYKELNVMSAAITLRHLRYFIATAETGKFQLAAEKTNMSASAVADAVKQLEELLGIPLFDRHSKGVTLTYDGHRFLNNSSSIIKQLDDSIFAFQNETLNVEGKIVLGASVSVMGYFLPKPLAEFEKVYPNVQIEMIENSRALIEKDLEQGKIDLAFIITSNVSISESTEIETLFRSKRTLWCSENHRFAEMETVPMQEIAKEKYIMLNTDESENNTKLIWDQFSLRPNIRVRSTSVEAVRGYIAGERGVAILSDLLYRPWSLDGTRIISKTIEEPIPTMNLGIVWNRNRQLSQAEQHFIDFFKSNSESRDYSPSYRKE